MAGNAFRQPLHVANGCVPTVPPFPFPLFQEWSHACAVWLQDMQA